MQVQTASNALPPARPSSVDTPVSGGDAFAQLLARQPEVDSEPMGDPAPGSGPGARPDEARAARARQTGGRPPAQAPKASSAETKPSAAKDGTKDTVEAQESRDEDPQEVAPPVDPALAQWLTQLQRPQAETEAAPPLFPQGRVHGAGASHHGGALDEDGTGSDATAALQPGEGRGVASTRASAQPRHRQDSEGADRGAMAAARETPLQAADETTGSAATPPRATSEAAFVLPANPEPAAAAAASAPATPAAAAPVDAPVSAAVPVPVDSAEFAEAFGVQVSVLVRDGVQQAELHLNPAEMGPVSVQIAMDGERARIDFGAQAAATRAAIEASLPELAAALRDAGLTLAGGGVSQQTSGRGDDSRQGSTGQRDGASGRPAAAESAATRPGWRGRVSAGGVDLYA